MHWNGYVREAAVRKLAEMNEGREIPLLLVRLNDWVPSIRALAYAALRAKLQARYAGQFIRSIALVQRLSHIGRARYEEFMEQLYGMLKREECYPDLQLGMLSAERRVRRFSYAFALENAAADIPLLLEQALRHPDTALRLMGARRVENVLAGERLWQALQLMAGDSYPPIRRAGLEGLAQHGPGEAIPALRKALLDGNLAVRETSRRLLNRLGPPDFAEFYLDAVWNGAASHLVAALYGLGETGTEADAEVIASYAEIPAVRVRIAVVRSLSRLRPEAYSALFQRWLTDDHPGISREASRALKRIPHTLHHEELVALVQPGLKVHILRNTLEVLTCINKWEQLEALLYLLRTSGPEWIKTEVKKQLDCWAVSFSRSFQPKPPAPYTERIFAELERCRSGLDGKQIKPQSWLIQ